MKGSKMINDKIKVGIAGAAGYTGGELIRILINHPNADIVCVHSNSNAGNLVTDVHTDLFGDTDLKFTNQLEHDMDVLFLCVGHGAAKKFLDTHEISPEVKIVDLSQDFRLNENSVYDGREFVYGLPELKREEIIQANNIANPGCFATCIQLGLLPLASKGLLRDDVHIQAATGSTGAGQGLSATSHFSWRNNNLSVYKAFEHQHLHEIGESLTRLQPGFDHALNFIPQRGNFTRGILASMYTQTGISLDDAYELYESFFADHPFTHVSRKNIDLKQVVNTNKCLIHLQKHADKIFIISITDNLLKGASGQAVQNMNLLFGLEETAGIKLKAAAF
jgi:N-acetyl-gamma-glutamyl-phosphate reductase